uniref:Peptidase M12B propeptide domain-containing protein n=1 Tax=Ficedula albicollis TaxID=59894 RepID=A0A803V1C3_FICAL
AGKGLAFPSGCLGQLFLFFPGFQDISLLTSYEVVTPQRLGRERREASSSSSIQVLVSYAIEIEGKEYTIHLEKNKELLPKDFTVYTYDKEGKLQLDHPDVQVGFPLDFLTLYILCC